MKKALNKVNLVLVFMFATLIGLSVSNAKTLKVIADSRVIYNGNIENNNVSYHKDQNNLDYESNLQEIKLCHAVIFENLGIEMNLFAPPSGAYNINTVDAATSLNYSTIMWTHDTIDWRDQDENLIFNRATKNLSNGDLVLMHPTKKTVEALPNIISTAINNGFNPTTVSNCLI